MFLFIIFDIAVATHCDAGKDEISNVLIVYLLKTQSFILSWL